MSEYSVFEVEKIKIIAEPEVEFAGECTFIRPYVKSEFTLRILMKRFWQIESLVTTHPRNLIKKLEKVIKLEKLKITTPSTPLMTRLELNDVYVYVWRTNNNSVVYVIPVQDVGDFVIFKTQSENCYCIDLYSTLHEVIARYPNRFGFDDC